MHVYVFWMTVHKEMDDLINAAQDNVLGVLPVDIQFGFCTPKLALRVNQVCEQLRDLGHNTDWIFLGSKPGYFPNAYQNNPTLDLSEFDLTAIRSSVKIAPIDNITVKVVASAFHERNPQLRSSLIEQGKTTQIFMGVAAFCCLKKTVQEALKEGFRSYVCLDATNCPPTAKQDWLDAVLQDSDIDPNLLTVTNTKDVVNLLTTTQSSKFLSAHHVG